MSSLSTIRRKVSSEVGVWSTVAGTAYKQAPISVETFGSQSTGIPSLFGGSRDNSKEFYEAFRGWVYVAINTIARRAAGQPVVAARKIEEPQAKRRVPISKTPYQMQSKLTPGYTYELLDNHNVMRVFDNPNPIQGRWEFTYATLCSMYLTGVFYWVGGVTERDGEERLEVYTIPTAWMTPKHDGSLFSGYDLRLPGQTDPIRLEPDQVVRGALPDPMNPLRGAISPVGTQWPAVRIDQKIQKSQEAGYDNGLFPSLAVAVGQDVGVDGKPLGRRPVLEGWQRNQIITAVRRLVGGVLNSNEPLILDGLIENVFPIENKPREMDWIASGDQVKRRIFQAFGLNPINAGEDVGTNRAQAAVADQHMAANTVNPILDIISNKATNWVQRLYDDRSLLVWWQPVEPKDRELRLKELEALRKANDISRNEMRKEYGFDEVEEEQGEKPAILETAAGLTSGVNALAQVGTGAVPYSLAVAIFSDFFGPQSQTVQALAEYTGQVVDQGGREEQEEEPELDEDAPDLDMADRSALAHVLSLVGHHVARKWVDSVEGK